MKRVAVVGSGISGHVAAYRLKDNYDVTLYEADGRFGGHANTVDWKGANVNAVDTGFIVYNELTYPGLTQLLAELKVETVETDMSFGVHDLESNLQYSTRDLRALFAQPLNALSPKFLSIWKDFFKFRKYAMTFLKTAKADTTTTLGELLNEAKCGKAFRQYFLYPMSGAIWSTTPEAMDSYPAISFLNFMINHRMLDPLGQPIWRTVVGGSKHYVNAIGEQGGFRRFKSSPVTALKRIEGGVKVIAEHVLDEVYDEVIVATHSDQALKMLTDPSKAERQVLGGVTYQPNEAVLHKDITAMPPNTRAWAAWNVVVDKVARDKVELTYDMNRLQHIEGDPCLVTLNPYRDIDPNKVVKTMSYMHPFFDISTLKSQLRWSEISGVDRIHYCGAYWKWGFHEDGLWSAMRVVDQLMLKDKVEQKSA